MPEYPIVGMPIGGAINLIRADELERLVRATFPGKRQFSAESALGGRAGEPAGALVHGGPDPFLDCQSAAALVPQSITVVM